MPLSSEIIKVYTTMEVLKTISSESFNNYDENQCAPSTIQGIRPS